MLITAWCKHRGFWLTGRLHTPLGLSHACTHTGPRDTNEASHYVLPLCDFYLGVRDVICVFPIYGPPHLSPGVLQEREENLTGQDKVITCRERTIISYKKRYCRAGTAPGLILCCPKPNQPELCLPAGRNEANIHFLTNCSKSLTSLDMMICDRQINRKKYPAFSNVLQIPWLHQVTHPKGHAPCQPRPWKAGQC